MRVEDHQTILLGDTPIPDVFIQDVMPRLSGQAVKCYLFLKSVAHHGAREATRADLADRLGISEAAVDEALVELVKRELITLGERQIAVNDVKMQEIHKRYRPITSSRPTDIVARDHDEKARLDVVDTIRMTFFQGLMTLDWYDAIDRWFVAYGFEPDVVYAVFQEAANKNKLDGPGYAMGIAENWAAAGVKTYAQLTVYYERFMATNDIKAHVAKTLRRKLTAYDLKEVERWVDDYGYDKSVIDFALSKTTSAANPSVRYVGAILTGWHKEGLQDLEAIKAHEQAAYAKWKRTGKASGGRDNRDNFSAEEDIDWDDELFDTDMPRLKSDEDDVASR